MVEERLESQMEGLAIFETFGTHKLRMVPSCGDVCEVGGAAGSPGGVGEQLSSGGRRERRNGLMRTGETGSWRMHPITMV